MKDIKRQAHRFVRKLKGDISFRAVKKYIEGKGYTVQFIGTTQGDEFLKRLGVSGELLQGKTAFAVSGAAKIIFVDKEKSRNEKLLPLLHEVGHIALGHMDAEVNLGGDSIHLESEAQMFADTVFDSRYGARRFKVIIALISAAFFILAAASAIGFKRYAKLRSDYYDYGQASGQMAAVSGTASSGAQAGEEEYVYITPHGESYHRAECAYANNSFRAIRSEAKRYYAPCAYCKP